MNVLSKFKLDDKVAIVTGGGRGIGKTIAIHFAHVGAHLVITSLHQSTVEATAQEVRAAGGDVCPLWLIVPRVRTWRKSFDPQCRSLVVLTFW